MTLKEFVDEAIKNSPFAAINIARDLIELESIERRLNIMFGVELDVRVKKSEVKEARFYGKGLIDEIAKKVL